MPEQRPCQTHPEIVKLEHGLPRFADALKRQRKIKVVAFGSSSTAGTRDGVQPYPPRLETLLRRQDQFFGFTTARDSCMRENFLQALLSHRTTFRNLANPRTDVIRR